MPCRAFFVPPRGEHRELGEHRGQGLNALSGVLRFSTRAHDRRLGRRRLVSMPCRAFFVSPLSVAELVSQWTACLNALSGILRFSTRAEEHDMSKLGQGVSQCPVG